VFDAFTAVFGISEALPRWLRPALFGAAFLLLLVFIKAGGIVGAITVTIIATISMGWKGLFIIPGALAVAVPAGAVAGFVFGLLRPIRSLGRITYIPTWVVTVAVYLAVVLWVLGGLGIDEEFKLTDPDTQLAFGITAVIFGIVLGIMDINDPHVWDDGFTQPEAPSEVQLQEAVDRDLARLRDWAQRNATWRRQLADLESGRPSLGAVQHWRRVADGLDGSPFLLRQRAAWRAARRQYQAARAAWSKVKGLSTTRAA
jgi:hypothetical protein